MDFAVLVSLTPSFPDAVHECSVSGEIFWGSWREVLTQAVSDTHSSNEKNSFMMSRLWALWSRWLLKSRAVYLTALGGLVDTSVEPVKGMVNELAFGIKL